MKRIIFSLAAVFLCMCMPMKTSTNYKSVHHKKPLYELDNLGKSYQHYLVKTNEKTTGELLTTLKKYAEKPADASGKVPPGIYADYAVLMICREDLIEAQKHAENEISLYPEAETYIKRLLKSHEK